MPIESQCLAIDQKTNVQCTVRPNGSLCCKHDKNRRHCNLYIQRYIEHKKQLTQFKDCISLVNLPTINIIIDDNYVSQNAMNSQEGKKLFIITIMEYLPHEYIPKIAKKYYSNDEIFNIVRSFDYNNYNCFTSFNDISNKYISLLDDVCDDPNIKYDIIVDKYFRQIYRANGNGRDIQIFYEKINEINEQYSLFIESSIKKLNNENIIHIFYKFLKQIGRMVTNYEFDILFISDIYKTIDDENQTLRKTLTGKIISMGTSFLTTNQNIPIPSEIIDEFSITVDDIKNFLDVYSGDFCTQCCEPITDLDHIKNIVNSLPDSKKYDFDKIFDEVKERNKNKEH